MTVMAQDKVFDAWMAEFPEPKRMTHSEIYQMIRDKVGHADPDTMTEWIYRLKDRLGVVIDYSDDDDDDSSDDELEDEVEEVVFRPPCIYHKWWEHLSPLIVNIDEKKLLILKDDGSHKWRYMTNLQLGEDKKDWEFIIRNMDETTELQLMHTPFRRSGESVIFLQMQTGTTSTRIELSEADGKVLSKSVRQLMMNAEDITAPRERTITELGEKRPRRYTVNEQIYTSRFLNFDDDED